MSKTCAICGENITFLSENKLGKDYPKVKICFTCYEYVATALKGNKTAVERLRARYRDDIEEKIENYIDTLNDAGSIDVKGNPKDDFIDLMSNDLSKVQTKETDKPKNNIIRLDRLSEAKKDRLIRIHIISNFLIFTFLLFGLLFSFYLLTQGYGTMLSIVMAIVSIGFAFVFYVIKTFLSTILDIEGK